MERVKRIKPKHRGTENLVLFKKGERRIGRTKGTPNRTTKLIREAAILAAESVGSDGKGRDGLKGYLAWAARREPVAFLKLLEKILPTQLHVAGTGEGGAVKHEHTHELKQMTAQQYADALKARGLPVPGVIDVTPNKKELPLLTAKDVSPTSGQEQDHDEDGE
jgi:hypothetical protein